MIRTVKQFLDQEKNKTLVLVNKAFPKYAILINVSPDPVSQVMYKKNVVVSDVPITENLNKDIISSVTNINHIPVELLKTIVRFDVRFSMWKTGEATWNSLLLTEGHKSFVLEKNSG